MSSSRNIYRKGRNITIIQEIMPNLKIKDRMNSIPITKKLNITQILRGSDTSNLQALTSRLTTLHTLDNNYSSDINYYSALLLVALISSIVAIVLAFVLVSAIISEYKATEDMGDIRSESFEVLQTQDHQLKELNTPHGHLYENDKELHRKLTTTTNPMYLTMGENSTIIKNNLDKH